MSTAFFNDSSSVINLYCNTTLSSDLNDVIKYCTYSMSIASATMLKARDGYNVDRGQHGYANRSAAPQPHKQQAVMHFMF